MKRANSFVQTLGALALCSALSPVLSSATYAADSEPQACAKAAHELTGETQYELIRVKSIVQGKDWYQLTLAAGRGDTKITCKTRNGRVKDIRIDLNDAIQGVALNS